MCPLFVYPFMVYTPGAKVTSLSYVEPVKRSLFMAGYFPGGSTINLPLYDAKFRATFLFFENDENDVFMS